MNPDWLGLSVNISLACQNESFMDRPSNPASRLAAAMIIAASSSVVPVPASAESGPDLDQLTAQQAAADLCAGKITSKALVSAALARAKAKANLNAFITLDETGAMKQAAAFDASHNKGKSCEPLGGVPVVVKDNIEVAGLPSSAGTPALKDYVPKQDAPVVEKLRAAGAIIIGKTNMHELAFGISGYNGAFKTGTEPGVRNAYDPSKIAGGSSSGTASAIGARIVTAGLGTDTGGSVRIPCALNGCASLRPTVGRYPQGGIAPIARTRDTAGCMASTMADVAILDRAIAGGGAIAPAAINEVRIGIVNSMLANVDGDTDKAFHAAIDRLKSAGVAVVKIDMPKLTELNDQVAFPVALYEAYDDMLVYLKHTGTGITIEELAFANNKLDAIAFPTTPKVAIPANPDSSSIENFILFIQNTDPGSNAGVPGVQLPVGLGATTKLPVGLELDGPAGSDRRLIAIGMAMEKLFGRLPPPSTN